MALEEIIQAKLKQVKYPGFSRDIVSFGLVQSVQIEKGVAIITLSLSTNEEAVVDKLRNDIQAVLEDIREIERFDIHIHRQAVATPAKTSPSDSQFSIPGVKHIIAVASGKGGVGKSTVAANLACAFEQMNLKTGLCDCDMYGPSMALMFGTTENPQATEDEKIVPIERYGLKLMSMGFLVDASAPAVLRGPMVTRFTQQFLRGVIWGDLDVLILDLPPGTGDIQLTVVQNVVLTGAVIVTTPQEVALIDARKAVGMFGKVNVKILGLIENMSYFLCPSDGKRYDIFGSGGGKAEAEKLGVPLLAQIPIDMATREAGDEGKPIVLRYPDIRVSQVFREAAKQIASFLN
ncbi:MAG: Mrp/NBP35 family ATP-binding protein [Verrucomicrobiae bacterium]|nr:Mrp/NBP35 family ATP-binding protein [Verrucomicrobiae bacterium]